MNLNNCERCGGKPTLTKHRGYFICECPICGDNRQMGDTPEVVAYNWNSRNFDREADRRYVKRLEQVMKKLWGRSNYRLHKIKCCANCNHITSDYDGEIFCNRYSRFRGETYYVEGHGVCDYWREVRK